MRGKVVGFKTGVFLGWDHPRACGEKHNHDEPAIHGIGSPPRMRGKAKAAASRLRPLRITPAHAGKRVHRALMPGNIKDHPRACGEKLVILQANVDYWGSPPRMRGEDSCARFPRVEVRITPAHAGRSLRLPDYKVRIRDHPRACGEKLLPNVKALGTAGSPPRMRGEGSWSCRW